ncbi:hypothetical protein VUR80DRAFT_4886 [Thermomyces stellatus]
MIRLFSFSSLYQALFPHRRLVEKARDGVVVPPNPVGLLMRSGSPSTRLSTVSSPVSYPSGPSVTIRHMTSTPAPRFSLERHMTPASGPPPRALGSGPTGRPRESTTKAATWRPPAPHPASLAAYRPTPSPLAQRRMSPRRSTSPAITTCGS